ncbi:uncharacterized protein LOC127240296 isoform X2 [Andrographis paniculata]|uniref:uncharacterized protein LOC127240296 isoform X2 n=1 Tax=Andrographis paniculata TaxID=175694 RepID=UPI0021E7CEC4|nr:uncharacterized protein LOC127240296 isoform X2 [Andrographis paniculata]
MDYNDNDYEGHNLPLTSEESSKFSSVLRPFALPKFDFDDNLHAHLRFDSLVENEAFLGIPNQEDNQWIEDYSRGGNGIEFSAAAAVSCALPRHVNVWSEATSSESVEMLLKAVGQEEMVQGENIEESDPGNQLASSTGHTEKNLRPDDMIEDVEHQNSSFPPTGVEGNISRSNLSAGLEDALSEYTLPAQETNFSAYNVCDDSKDDITITTENLNSDMKNVHDKPVDGSDLVNDSQPNQVQGNFPILDTDINFTRSTSQSNVVSVKEFYDQDKISGSGTVNASCIAECISDATVKEQEEQCEKNDERLKGVVETGSILDYLPSVNQSKVESSKEEQAVEVNVKSGEDVSCVPSVGKSVCTDGFNEVALNEPAAGSQHETVVLSSGTDAKHLDESCGILPGRSFVSIEGEGGVGYRINGSDVASPTNNDKITNDSPVIQSSDRIRSGGDDDDVLGSNSSLEGPDSTVEPSVFHEVLSTSPKQDDDKNTNPADDVGNLKDTSSAVECCKEKSVLGDAINVLDSSATQKDIVKEANHVSSPSTAGSLQTCKEDITSMQVDNQEDDLVGSVQGKKDEILSLDSSNSTHDDKMWQASSGEGNTKTTIGLQPTNSAGDYPGVNLGDSHESNTPSRDKGHVIQSKENDSDVLEQPNTSVSEEVLMSTKIAIPVAIEKEPDSAAESTRMNEQSILLGETSAAAAPDATCVELNKTVGHPVDNFMVQDGGAEGGPIEGLLEAKKEKDHGMKSSSMSAAVCTVEIERSIQAADPGTGLSGLAQDDMNKKASLERINAQSIGEILTKSETAGAIISSKDEGPFTFEMKKQGVQSTGDFSMGLQSFPRIQACKMALAGERSSSSAGGSLMDAVVVTESPHVSSVTTSAGPPSGGTTERKARRGSSKSARGSAKKVNKEIPPLRHTDKGGKSSQLLSPLGAGQLMAFESVLKPRGAVSVPTCGLPDLNTSSGQSSAFFQQPFTDLQQVQLRAQIFVYGSLIQGVAPDEACMISAFGTSGGRSIWEVSWRACVERLQNQKSQGTNSETPLPSRPGVKTPDQTNRQSSIESEVIPSATSRGGTKPIPSPVVNPLMPLSSPLWNMATPSCEGLPLSSMTKSSSFDYQALSPLNPSQIPPIRNYVAHTSGPLQASFPVPWLASSLSSPFDITTSYPNFTIMEPVKLTPAKEAFLPIGAGTKHISPIPATLTAATSVFAGTPSLPVPVTLTAATTVFTGTPSLDSKRVKSSGGQTSDTKTRKRKKSSGDDVLQIPVPTSQVDTQSAPLVSNQLSKRTPGVEGFNQISLTGHNQASLIPKSVIESHYTASVSAANSSSLISKNTTNQFLSVVPSSITADCMNRCDSNIDKMMLNVESLGKVKEARSQAEDAAALAAAAISQCEGMWNQLNQHKNSGLSAETEYQVASAAVQIAAAAAVAKAAAAAAKIASTAALEAKQMADEVIAKSGLPSTTNYGAVLTSNAMKLPDVSPFSILQGGNWNNASSLVISAAKEATRKRIEAASTATRQAENLDAIVKAAELAAEAVSHAGKIVTLNDHFSLSDLAMAGPSNYLKGLQVVAPPGSNPGNLIVNKSISSNAGEVSNFYMSQHGKSDLNMHVISNAVSPIERDSSRNLGPDHVTVEGNVIASMKNGEKNSKPQKDNKASNGSKFPGIWSDTDSVPSIKESSYVEVLKNRGDLKAWFTATVLTVKEADALVCYTELKSDEGSELLKEWVSLEAKDGNAPQIRIPHPMSAVQSEGTRKRRRAAAKDYTWVTGDRVDAWVQDCWCEGIVAEKNPKDAAALNIHFPDLRDTLSVKLWHLRPTLVWSNGQWTEWCRPGHDSTLQGDTPDEKRVRLGGAFEMKGGAKMAKSLTFGEAGKNEKPGLPLSASDKVFNVGSTKEQNKPKTGRTKTKKPASEKAPRVVIGVPKPGKRRKFMEVSKHYVSEGSSKASVLSDSTKLAKILNPQVSGTWGTKNKSKPDAKDKQVAESKTKAPKSGKPPSIPSKNVPKKDGSTSSQANEHDATVSDQALVGSTSHEENDSGGQNITEFGSFTNVEATSEETMPSSSQDVLPDNRKKVTRNANTERNNQGKPASTSEESLKDEANEGVNSDVAERRRSNRRIQPTSRLLEGLQSSMVIPKFPSTSHDKGPRSHKKRPNQRE